MLFFSADVRQTLRTISILTKERKDGYTYNANEIYPKIGGLNVFYI